MGVSRAHKKRTIEKCDRIELTSVPVNKEEGNGLMVLCVRPTLSRFPTNILHTPMDCTPLFSKTRLIIPVGAEMLFI